MTHDKIIIAVGGNIYNSEGVHPMQICDNAINLLNDYHICVVKQSKWYVSEPIPVSSQPKYYNKVIIAKSMLNEVQILNTLHNIEEKFGRIRNITNEPRVLDLDLIDCFGIIRNNNNITLPHPRAHLRRFVIEPLAEIHPHWTHPIYKNTATQILENLDNQNVKILT